VSNSPVDTPTLLDVTQVPLLLLAVLTLVPGGYATFHLVGVARRWPGYTGDLMGFSDMELV